MKQLILVTLIIFATTAFASADDGNVMKRSKDGVLHPKPPPDKHVSDAMRQAMGGDPTVSVAMSSDPQGQDRIEGKCESKTKDAISVTIPCKDVELILKRGDKTIETTDLDPRGNFLFDKLSPNYTYTMMVRKKTSTHSSQMDGMKTGMIYTFSIDE